MKSDEPYTEQEAHEAAQWVNRHGPSNAWTATAGTAARMIGRLLVERERLQMKLAAAERQLHRIAMDSFSENG